MRPSQVVFTRFVNEICFKYRGVEKTIRINRDETQDSIWVRIVPSEGLETLFRVWRGDLNLGKSAKAHQYSVAVQCDGSGLPVKIPESERFFHLVFPTEHKSWVPFLVDGEFDMHGQDRGQLADTSKNLSLINAAYGSLFEAARTALLEENSKEKWLAWFEMLAPNAFFDGANSFFTEKLSAAKELRDSVATFLLSHVPHGVRTRDVRSLTIPSALFRRFAIAHGDEFSIQMDDWIDKDIELAVRSLGAETSDPLASWVGSFNDDETLRNIEAALRRFKPSNIEHEEMRKALETITKRLTPRLSTSPLWEIDDLVNWWRDNRDEEPYTVEGRLFEWLAPSDHPVNPTDKRSLMYDWLRSPETSPGREVWYRMLSYACLVSAGRRHSEVESFEKELKDRHFFERTSKEDFDSVGSDIFNKILHRPFRSDTAVGEQADFWRRVYYDIKKIHFLVYRNDFAEVFLDLIRNEVHAENAIDFLRGGNLPAQPRYRGVIGQSALSPLFFVVRELRRLRVVTHSNVDCLAFFVCRPVRRIACQMNWISIEEEERSGQENLVRVAAKIHEMMSSHPEAKEHLLPYFDIPLLALAQSGKL